MACPNNCVVHLLYLDVLVDPVYRPTYNIVVQDYILVECIVAC